MEVGFDTIDRWAAAATCDPAEVEAERGVVREEFRLNVEVPGWDAYQWISDAYDGGIVYEGRLPIDGDPEAILTTTADQAQLSYDSWYRPDKTAIIAVGDLPVAYPAVPVRVARLHHPHAGRRHGRR